MAEAVWLLKTVLTELTVLKEEIKQVASDIQQLKDQVRVLTVAANDMVVQLPRRSFLKPRRIRCFSVEESGRWFISP